MIIMPKKNIISIAGYSIIIISIINIILIVNFNKNTNRKIVTSKFECNPVKMKCAREIDDKLLKESLALGTNYLINNQKREGNFFYQYNAEKKKYSNLDNQIRQAETFWGLVQIYLYNNDENVLKTIKKCYSFFSSNFKNSENKTWVIYPTGKSGKTGTLAMVAMAMIDFFKSNIQKAPELNKNIEKDIHKIINAIMSMKNSDSRFHQYYDDNNGTGFGKATAYTDTQCLLAIVKYIKAFKRNDLIFDTIKSTEITYKENITDVIAIETDSKRARNFFKWGSMLTYELATSGWENTAKFSVNTIELTDWIIDAYSIITKSYNASYAIEGIIYGYMTAQEKDDMDREIKYKCVINCLMRKLFTYQVGGPINTKSTRLFLDDKTLGGILQHRKKPFLRIDLTYKQMNAMLLVLKHMDKD